MSSKGIGGGPLNLIGSLNDFNEGSFRKYWDWDCAYMLAPPKRFVAFNLVVDVNCEVTAGHKYVHFSPSGIAPGGCFPRARLQPPCPGKGYADVVRKGRF